MVLPSDGYYTTRLLAADELARFGIEVDVRAHPEIEAFAAGGGLDGVRLVLLETPSNPQLDVCDIAAVARGGPGGRRAGRRRQHDRHAARASGRWRWAPT